MRLFAKELFRKFHELPENLTPKHYRSFVFTNYAFLMAGIFHFEFYLGVCACGLKDIDRLVNSAKDLNQSNAFEDDFTILKVSFD